MDPVEAYIILCRYVNDSRGTALQREQELLDEALKVINKFVTQEKDNHDVCPPDNN